MSVAAPPRVAISQGVSSHIVGVGLPALLLLGIVYLCLTTITVRLGYNEVLLPCLKDLHLPSSIALTFLLYLLFPSAFRGSKGGSNDTKQAQDDPGTGARVLSRQLSACSLQQSLCKGPSSRNSNKTRQGGLAPVRKLLRRIFSNSSSQQLQHQHHHSVAAVSQGNRRGQTRTSVDCVLSPSAPSADAIKATQRASLGNSPSFVQGPSAQRWHPEVARIASGQDLQALEVASGAGDGSADASAQEGKESELGAVDSGNQLGRQLGRLASAAAVLPSITGTGAVDCLKNEATDPLMRPDISVAVPEAHLLQLGALLGEHGAQSALKEKQQQGMNCPAGPGPSTFLGITDAAAQYAEGWEPLIEEHRPGLHYWAWRRYLRKGLFMYKSRTVFEGGVTVPQLAAFNFDWRFKQASDEGCACMHPMLPPGCSVGSGGSCTEPAGAGAALFLAAAATCPDPAGALVSPTSAPRSELSSSGARAVAPDSGVSGSCTSGVDLNAFGRDSNRAADGLNMAGGASRCASVTGADGEGGGVQGGRQLQRFPSNSSSASSSCGRMAQSMPVSAAVRSLEEELESRTFNQSCYLYSRTRFPPPMAARQYIYARRVWLKTDDGGCYVVSRAAFDHPCPPPFSGRAVNVDDMVSGYVIRSAHGIYDRSSPAAEMVSLYFEDSRVSPGMVNLGVRKALWPIVQKMNEALRMYESCTGTSAEQNGDPSSKIAKAAAAVRVRSDHALNRHQRVLQRYGSSTSSGVCGGGGSGAAAGDLANISGSAAVSGAASGSGNRGAATAAAAAVAAAEAAAFEEEALILRAFDAGTLLPRQSRRFRLLPVLYRAYLGACTVVGGAARAFVYTAHLALRLQLTVHRAGMACLQKAVLSQRYATLCKWLQQLSNAAPASNAAPNAFARGSKDAATNLSTPAPKAFAQGWNPPFPGRSEGSVVGLGGLVMGWGWLQNKGSGLQSEPGSRSQLSSHPLHIRQSQMSFRSHPLCAMSFRTPRASVDSARGGEDSEDGGGAHEGEARKEGGRPDMVLPRQQQQTQKSGGRGHVGRRLIAKGATFALRAAALPLMHRALRAYASNEGAGGAVDRIGQQQKGGSKRLQQQQQLDVQEDMEAAEQRSLRRAQWLSAVARSRNAHMGNENGRGSSSSGRGSGSGGIRDLGSSGNGRVHQSASNGDASVQPPLNSRHSFGEASVVQQLQQNSNSYNYGGTTLTPPLSPHSSSKAQASQPSGGFLVPPHVHSFPTLLSASGQESWNEGGSLAGVEWEGGRASALRNSYRRARSSLQFGGPSLVVEGVPMAPEPSLRHRSSAKGITSGTGISGTEGSFFDGDELLERQSVHRGGRQDAGVQQGKGSKRGTASSSHTTSSTSAVAPRKQGLTLSEMGMLHGNF